MAKYKSLAKVPKKSPAAKTAETRNKGVKQAKAGDYSKGVKTISSAGKSRRMTRSEKRVVSVTPFTPKQVPQPPTTAKSQKGLSLNKLVAASPRFMKETAMECYVSHVKRGKTSKALPFITAQVRHKDPFRPNKTVRLHETMIVGLDSPFDKITKQKRVMVSCSCENFVFMWEYADAEHGAARIIYGNGEPPGFTNPGHAPGLCKHLLALASAMKINGD